MVLQLGLVGLPNVGKSTLFNALTQAGAMVANYPFTTIDPNVGVVPVPDLRLQRIADIIEPEQAIPTTLRVVDIAGLVKGASQGEGLGNKFLSHIRGVDAIAMVVRCFEAEDVAHVTDYLDPVEDAETIELELALADLDLLERRLERVRVQAKARPREYEDELRALADATAALESGLPVRQMEIEEKSRRYLHQADLLTLKPLFYVANVSEGQLPKGGELAERLERKAQAQGTQAIVLCAPLEAEVATWAERDALEYLSEIGLDTPSLHRFIRTGYRLLDYITFFTTTGGKVVRGWTLIRGQTAIDAAAEVHTDMARGFIRAEVVGYEDLMASGSIAKAREMGQLQVEGRDYVVRDGDVIHIRFNV